MFERARLYNCGVFKNKYISVLILIYQFDCLLDESILTCFYHLMLCGNMGVNKWHPILTQSSYVIEFNSDEYIFNFKAIPKDPNNLRLGQI